RLPGGDEEHSPTMQVPSGGCVERQRLAVAPQRFRHQPARIDRRDGGVEARTGGMAKRRIDHGRATPPSLYHHSMSPDYAPGEPESLPPPNPAVGFIETWRRVMSDPRGFFTDMPQVGGLQEPLIFLTAIAGLNALGSLLLGWGLGGAVSAFVSMIVGAFVAAAALTLVAQHLFNGRAGFEPIFRVVAYATAPLVFLWL